MKKKVIVGTCGVVLLLAGSGFITKNKHENRYVSKFTDTIQNMVQNRNEYGYAEQTGNQKELSNALHLYLYEKDASWNVVGGGAWGKMDYYPEGTTFKFVFNGHELEPGTNYSLIYYPDPWPGRKLICLGEGIAADNDGNVNVLGDPDTGDLPAEFDDNYPYGAKFWLVLADDVDCVGKLMTGWHPVEYLFEENLIIFNDTND